MSGKPSPKKFEFVTSSTDPSKAADDARRRRLVRTQAKRHSLEAPVLPAGQGSTTPGDISAYISRFHLRVPPKQANEVSKEGKATQRIINAEHSLGESSDSDPSHSDSNHSLELVRRTQPSEARLPRSLGAGLLNPFRTLSIETANQEELLFQYGW